MIGSSRPRNKQEAAQREGLSCLCLPKPQGFHNVVRKKEEEPSDRKRDFETNCPLKYTNFDLVLLVRSHFFSSFFVWEFGG